MTIRCLFRLRGAALLLAIVAADAAFSAAGPRAVCAATDPTVKVGDVGVVGVRGGFVLTPVRVTDSAAGIESADITIVYDTNRLDLSDSDVTLSAYLTAQGWLMQAAAFDSSGYTKVTVYTTGATLTAGTPDLFSLTFHIPESAPAGTSPVTIYTDFNLSRLNEGGLPLTAVNGSIVIPFDWKGGGSPRPTDWGLSDNWFTAGVPDGAGVAVRFGKQVPANSVVDMISQGRTVGSMVFAADASTTIRSTGGFDLTLDNNGIAATIDVSGNHTISAPVVLNSDLQIGGAGALNLSGGLSGPHTVSLLAGGSLTARSIQVDTLSIGAGASVVIAETLPGGSAVSGSAFAVTPEPGTWVLLAAGAACLLPLVRRAIRPTGG
jgi:hypothetical protein